MWCVASRSVILSVLALWPVTLSANLRSTASRSTCEVAWAKLRAALALCPETQTASCQCNCDCPVWNLDDLPLCRVSTTGMPVWQWQVPHFSGIAPLRREHLPTLGPFRTEPVTPPLAASTTALPALEVTEETEYGQPPGQPLAPLVVPLGLVETERMTSRCEVTQHRELLRSSGCSTDHANFPPEVSPTHFRIERECHCQCPRCPERPRCRFESEAGAAELAEEASTTKIPLFPRPNLPPVGDAYLPTLPAP